MKEITTWIEYDTLIRSGKKIYVFDKEGVCTDVFAQRHGREYHKCFVNGWSPVFKELASDTFTLNDKRFFYFKKKSKKQKNNKVKKSYCEDCRKKTGSYSIGTSCNECHSEK